MPPNLWNGFLSPSDANAMNVAIDHHEYQVFDNGLLHMSPFEHAKFACSHSEAYNGADKWTFGTSVSALH
jgi:glucan 1,3-beta-glucosidase